MLIYTSASAQVTVTINATGTTGSFKTGAVNAAGTKVDGNLTNISTTAGANRGWASFDLSTLPAGAAITAVDVIFTTYSSTLSSATNSIRGFIGNPVTTAGATLYTNINNGTLLSSVSWPAAATVTAGVSATGLTFFQANANNPNVVIGFVRGSTNSYNIHGYPGTTAQQPQLRITYLLPCSGIPTAGVITAPAAVCPGSTFAMTISGQSTGSGISYQWQSRPTSGGTFTNIPASNTSALNTNTNIPTDYRCLVTCTNSSQSSFTNTVSVGINSFYICYCKTALGGSTTGSIDSVSILETTLRSASTGSVSPFYTQYLPSGNRTATLQAGGLYTLYVKYGSSTIGSMWIDANQNGSFEPSEWVRINNTASNGMVVFQVPPTALSGLTGMRIRSATTGNGAANACTNNADGETEDFVVTISPAPVNDIKVQAVLTPINGSEICPFKEVPARVVVYNNGSAPASTFNINLNLSGPAPMTNIITYSGTLAPFRTDTLTFPNYTFMFIGSYQVRAFITQGGVDANPANDTSALVSFLVKPSANIPITRIDSVCVGQEGMLHVLPDGYKHNWYTTPTYGGLVFTGDTLKIPNMQQDSLLYVCSAPSTLDTGSLTTTSAAGNGCGGGAMFNVLPNISMRIDSFAALFASTGTQVVNVYYRLGTFAGNETNAGAWALLGTANVNVSSTTALTRFTINNPFFVTGGLTYGIYINYNASYTNGTTTFSNPDVSIQTGTGLCSAFGGTNAGRMFNGSIFYSKGGMTCESPLLPIKAFVGQAPVVNLGPDIVGCDKQDIILDAGHFGATYKWNNLLQTQTINVKDAPGTYWVEVDRYCVGSDTVTVTLNPLPKTTGIAYTRVGNTYKFTAGGISNAKSVLWLFGDGGSSIMVNPDHIYATGGSYKVLLILSNDCGSDTTAMIIPLGISNIQSGNAVSIYPNPATDNITLEFDNAPAKGADMIVVNSVGATVVKLKSNGTKKEEINTSSLPAGNYILRVIDAEAMATKPFVITR